MNLIVRSLLGSAMALVLATSCGRDTEAGRQLPPARGVGSPPRAELPTLREASASASTDETARVSDETTGTTFAPSSFMR